MLGYENIPNKKPQILVLHSYHPTLKWTKDLNDGIHSIFNDIQKVDLYIEYMDTKHYSSKEYMDSLINGSKITKTLQVFLKL